MNKILFIAFIFISIISCTPDTKNKVEEVEITSLQEKATVSSIGVTLSPIAKKEVVNWEKYQLIETKMQRYQSVTKSEAMQNARELSLLIEDASDTIDVKLLDRPDVKMRFNVLYNHAYRLHDMLSITSISEGEVMTEVTRLLDAYSSVNDKINVVYKIEEYKNSFGVTKMDTLLLVEEGMLSNDKILVNDAVLRSEKPKEKPKRKLKVNSNKGQPAKKELFKKRQNIPSKSRER